jgi:hypothetical protein
MRAEARVSTHVLKRGPFILFLVFISILFLKFKSEF